MSIVNRRFGAEIANELRWQRVINFSNTRSQKREFQSKGKRMPSKYIFGYGSLIQIESRTRTVPSAFAASPAIVKGITRGWYYQSPSAGLSPTYLGAVDTADATTNGVIYGVTDSE